MTATATNDFEKRARHDVERVLRCAVDRTRMLHCGRQNTIIYVAATDGSEMCVRYRTAVEFWYEDCVKEPYIESLRIVDLPRTLFADDSARPQMLISEYVVGDLLNDLVVDEQLAASVGRVLAAVHIPAKGATNYLDFANGRVSERAWSDDFAVSLTETALGCGYRTAEVADLLTACAGSLAAAEGCLVLVHNDVHFKNLIRRPDGSLCLLDWDSAVIAPAEKDFVKLLDWSHHNAVAVRTIVETHREATGRNLDRHLIELFRAYAILRQILFQRTAAEQGVTSAMLSQGGFFLDVRAQMAKLGEPLAALGLRPWDEP